MKLHTLKPAAGSTKNSKRIGRGTGSGRGGTSTKGHKGGQSRSGYSSKAGFEGGQMPLYRRIPKFGFKNPTRVEYNPINVSSLLDLIESIGLTTFSLDTFVQNGLSKKTDKVKVLGDLKGKTLSSSITVEAHAFSQSAKDSIEAAGGKIVIL